METLRMVESRYLEEGMRILVIAAVEKECDAVRRGMEDVQCQVDIVQGGVGPVAAAIAAATALSTAPYDLVMNVGIAGGFKGKINLGEIVVASEMISPDLGVQTQEGFLGLDEVGLGINRVQASSAWVYGVSKKLQGYLDITIGPVLTVSTATGTAQRAEQWMERVPEAVAEGMEGFGVASAAQIYKTPVIEMRAISNWVGPRNKAQWCMDKALANLENALSIWAKAPSAALQ